MIATGNEICCEQRVSKNTLGYRSADAGAELAEGTPHGVGTYLWQTREARNCIRGHGVRSEGIHFLQRRIL